MQYLIFPSNSFSSEQLQTFFLFLFFLTLSIAFVIPFLLGGFQVKMLFLTRFHFNFVKLFRFFKKNLNWYIKQYRNQGAIFKIILITLRHINRFFFAYLNKLLYLIIVLLKSWDIIRHPKFNRIVYLYCKKIDKTYYGTWGFIWILPIQYLIPKLIKSFIIIFDFLINLIIVIIKDIYSLFYWLIFYCTRLFIRCLEYRNDIRYFYGNKEFRDFPARDIVWISAIERHYTRYVLCIIGLITVPSIIEIFSLYDTFQSTDITIKVTGYQWYWNFSGVFPIRDNGRVYRLWHFLANNNKWLVTQSDIKIPRRTIKSFEYVDPYLNPIVINLCHADWSLTANKPWDDILKIQFVFSPPFRSYKPAYSLNKATHLFVGPMCFQGYKGIEDPTEYFSHTEGYFMKPIKPQMLRIKLTETSCTLQWMGDKNKLIN